MQHGWAFGMVVVFMDHVDGVDFIGVVCGGSTICVFCFVFLCRSYVLLVWLCFVMSMSLFFWFSLIGVEVKWGENSLVPRGR